MDSETYKEFIKRKPGYEVVFKLQQSDQRREQLAEYAGTSGGTLDRWIEDAENAGLISIHRHYSKGEYRTDVSLRVPVPDQLESVVEDRGGHGPRDDLPAFADVANFSHWTDEHSL